MTTPDYQIDGTLVVTHIETGVIRRDPSQPVRYGHLRAEKEHQHHVTTIDTGELEVHHLPTVHL